MSKSRLSKSGSSRLVAVAFLACAILHAGPVEFGQSELRAAMAERGVVLSITTEINLDPPETFHITAVNSTGARISGGDLRGLMYGLIEAAEQIRTTGKLVVTNGEPGFALRSVRVAPTDADLAAPGFYGTDKWTNFFKMLARNRINRVTLSLPPEKFELDRLRIVSLLAKEYGVDFHLGVRPGSQLTRAFYTQLRRTLDQAVLIHGVQLEVTREPVDTFRSVVFPAIRESGRLVTLDLRGTDARADVVRAAIAAPVTVEVAARSAVTALGQPFYVPIPAQAVAADVDPVRSRLTTLVGAGGFEIDLAGPNIEGYERTYWAWGRQGYSYRQPGLAPGKAAPKAKK